MEQAAIGSVLTDLAVGEKRLTDVGKIDGLLIVKVIDCRILAVTQPRPGSQQNRERLDIGVHGSLHIPSMTLQIGRQPSEPARKPGGTSLGHLH
jgi:hypothetical protein